MITVCVDARNVTDKTSGLVGYVQNLIEKLTKENDFHIIILCNRSFLHVFQAYTQHDHCRVVPVYFDTTFLSIRNLIFEYFYLGNIINTLHPDIYHNPFGFGIPRNLQCKVVLTVHDIIPLRIYDGLTLLQQYIFRLSFWHSLRETDMLVTISDATRRDIFAYYRDLHIPSITIYNGFDRYDKSQQLEKTFDRISQRLHIQKPYIVYVGSGTPRKNLVRFVKAFILLKKQFQVPHQLVLISKMDRSVTQKTKNDSIRLLAESHMDTEVVFAGYLDDSEKFSLLSEADMFVYPSLYEGFGLPILEALQCNIPVVCSDIGVFHEIAGDSCVYFDPLDPSDMANVMKKTIENNYTKKAFLEKNKAILEKYSWEKMTKEYSQLYRLVYAPTTGK